MIIQVNVNKLKKGKILEQNLWEVNLMQVSEKESLLHHTDRWPS